MTVRHARASPAPTRLLGRAPAKVNLALAVTGKREDGYHTLRSVFLRLDLADELSIRPSRDVGGPDRVRIAWLRPPGAAEGLAEDDNTVLRACGILRARLARPLPALEFRLRKRIPVAAGLAGGSSDAAAALDLASAAWGIRLLPAERMEVALALGADVPFFATGCAAALVGGIGERVEPLPGPRGGLGLVLVTPSLRLATADVFRALDAGAHARPDGPSAAVTSLAERLQRGLDATRLAEDAEGLRDANELWPAAVALAPALGVLRSRLEAMTGRAMLLSGSGSTLFALYASPEEARRAAAALAARLPSDVEDQGIRVTATSTSHGEDP